MDQHSAALPVARTTLVILMILNWVFGGCVLVLLGATIVAPQWTFPALGIPASSWMMPMMQGLRVIAVLGLVAIPLNHAILRRLLAIVETVRAGDPFVASNADRLQAIAWVLLTLQHRDRRHRQGHLDVRPSAASGCRLLDQRMAGGHPDVRARARLRRRHAHAPRARRHGVTWRSSSGSTTSCMTDA